MHNLADATEQMHEISIQNCLRFFEIQGIEMISSQKVSTPKGVLKKTES